MPSSLAIPILAILATPQVNEGVKERIMEGGERAKYALELCLKDKREMNETFYLEVHEGTQGEYKLACQMLQTTTGPFYAVKGQYRPTPTLDALVELFESKGITIVDHKEHQTDEGK